MSTKEHHKHINAISAAVGEFTWTWDHYEGEDFANRAREYYESMDFDEQVVAGPFALLVAIVAECRTGRFHSVYDVIQQLEWTLLEVKQHLARTKQVPYQDYLQSSHWMTQRQLAHERAHHCCQLCGDDDQLDVHHRTYERIWDELPQDLIVLCRHCHAKFHDKLP